MLQVFSVLYLTALIFGGQFLAGQFRRRRRLAAGATTGVGALFVGFGIKLATASAPADHPPTRQMPTEPAADRQGRRNATRTQREPAGCDVTAWWTQPSTSDDPV